MPLPTLPTLPAPVLVRARVVVRVWWARPVQPSPMDAVRAWAVTPLTRYADAARWRAGRTVTVAVLGAVQRAPGERMVLDLPSGPIDWQDDAGARYGALGTHGDGTRDTACAVARWAWTVRTCDGRAPARVVDHAEG